MRSRLTLAVAVAVGGVDAGRMWIRRLRTSRTRCCRLPPTVPLRCRLRGSWRSLSSAVGAARRPARTSPSWSASRATPSTSPCSAVLGGRHGGRCTLNVQGPDKFDATLQNPMLDAVAAAKPDALSGGPQRREGVAARSSGSRTPAPRSSSSIPGRRPVDRRVRIATNNELGGEKAAEALPRSARKGAKVLVISTDPGVSSVDARVAGLRKKAAELGFTQVSDTQYSHNQAATGAQVVSAALAKDPDLAGRLRHEPVHRTGRRDWREAGGQVRRDVKIVGFDAGPDQIKQLEAGDVQALVAQKPYDIGLQGVQQAVAALNGQPVTPSIETESLVVTKDNMADPDVSKYIYKSNC